MREDVIYEFPKNGREIVRVSIKEWNGQSLLDLRVCYQAKDGVFRPAQKGLCLRLEKLSELKTALEKLTVAALAWEGTNEDY